MTTEERPKRAYGEGSISQRPNGLWVGRLDIGVGPDNRRIRRQVTSMDQRKMLAKLDGLRADIAKYGRTADPSVTVEQWARQWLDEICAPRLKPRTTTTYRSVMAAHILPVIGHKKVAKLVPADIRAVRSRIIGADKSSTTALLAHRVLARCLKDALREGLILENPAGRVDAPRRAAATRGAFTAAQAKRLLIEAAKMPGGSRYIMALLTGARQAECLGLEWDHLHLDDGQAYIEWQLQGLTSIHGCGAHGDDGWPCGKKVAGYCPKRRWELPDGLAVRRLHQRYALIPVKNGKPRWVPLLPPLVAALRKHRQDTAGAPNPHGLVWCRADGRPIPHGDDEAGWKALLRAAGLPETCTLHWARHSVATLLMEAGIDAHVVGEIVGHSSLGVTRGYQHVSSALAQDAMTRLGELVAG